MPCDIIWISPSFRDPDGTKCEAITVKQPSPDDHLPQYAVVSISERTFSDSFVFGCV